MLGGEGAPSLGGEEAGEGIGEGGGGGHGVAGASVLGDSRGNVGEGIFDFLLMSRFLKSASASAITPPTDRNLSRRRVVVGGSGDVAGVILKEKVKHK